MYKPTKSENVSDKEHLVQSVAISQFKAQATYTDITKQPILKVRIW